MKTTTIFGLVVMVLVVVGCSVQGTTNDNDPVDGFPVIEDIVEVNEAAFYVCEHTETGERIYKKFTRFEIGFSWEHYDSEGLVDGGSAYPAIPKGIDILNVTNCLQTTKDYFENNVNKGLILT